MKPLAILSSLEPEGPGKANSKVDNICLEALEAPGKSLLSCLLKSLATWCAGTVWVLEPGRDAVCHDDSK